MPLTMRCDGVYDCDDHSDEKDCDILGINDNTYRKEEPPVVRGQKTKIETSIIFEEIEHIDELLMQMKVRFRITLQWKDSRLFFRNLKYEDNMLSEASQKQIWIPTLLFINSVMNIKISANDPKHIKVNRMSDSTERENLGLNEDLYFPGDQNTISLLAQYDEHFRCSFDMHFYPFDVQTCSIKLMVSETIKNQVSLTPSNLQFSGPKELLQFTVQDLDVTMERNNTLISWTLILRRNPIGHLATTYFPTLSIIIMALITLFINDSHFEAVIMVALTCMLVMYTLFQSISTYTPNTAYLTLLDIWLIFGLSMPFFVFMCEVSLELIDDSKIYQIQVNGKNIQKELIGSKRDNVKKIIQVILPISTAVFIVAYLLVVIVSSYA